MKKSGILLVTSNELLAAVYHLNIMNTFKIKLNVCLDFREAIDILTEDDSFDLILAPALENDIEVAALLYQHLVESGVDIPFIVFGDKQFGPEELTLVEDTLDINLLVNSIGSNLTLR